MLIIFHRQPLSDVIPFIKIDGYQVIFLFSNIAVKAVHLRARSTRLI